jgi:hypothetical protein
MMMMVVNPIPRPEKPVEEALRIQLVSSALADFRTRCRECGAQGHSFEERFGIFVNL